MHERDMEHIRALRGALRRTDISFFGPIFDGNLRKLDDGRLPYGERSRKAFDLTVNNKIIQRVGIEAILDAVQAGTCGTVHFSPASREALNRYVQEKAHI